MQARREKRRRGATSSDCFCLKQPSRADNRAALSNSDGRVKGADSRQVILGRLSNARQGRVRASERCRTAPGVVPAKKGDFSLARRLIVRTAHGTTFAGHLFVIQVRTRRLPPEDRLISSRRSGARTCSSSLRRLFTVTSKRRGLPGALLTNDRVRGRSSPEYKQRRAAREGPAEEDERRKIASAAISETPSENARDASPPTACPRRAHEQKQKHVNLRQFSARGSR